MGRLAVGKAGYIQSGPSGGRRENNEAAFSMPVVFGVTYG